MSPWTNVSLDQCLLGLMSLGQSVPWTTVLGQMYQHQSSMLWTIGSYFIIVLKNLCLIRVFNTLYLAQVISLLDTSINKFLLSKLWPVLVFPLLFLVNIVTYEYPLTYNL